MTSVSEPLYVAEQIHIPPALPEILKQFTKAAIKTQPGNTYAWAAEYFTSLAGGSFPNVLTRVTKEGAAAEVDGPDEGLGGGPTEELMQKTLVDLAATLGRGLEEVDVSVIESTCAQAGVPAVQTKDVIGLGKFEGTVQWKQFFAVLCGFLPELAELTLKSVIVFVVDTLGQGAGISLAEFSSLLKFVAGLDPDLSANQIDVFITDVAGKIGGAAVTSSTLKDLSIKDALEADKTVELASLVAEAGADAPAAAKEDAPAPAAIDDSEFIRLSILTSPQRPAPAAAATEAATATATDEADTAPDAAPVIKPIEDRLASISSLTVSLAKDTPDAAPDAIKATCVAAGVTEALADVVMKTGKFGESAAGSHVLILLCADAATSFRETCQLFADKLSKEDPMPLTKEGAEAACLYLASLDKNLSEDDAKATVTEIFAAMA